MKLTQLRLCIALGAFALLNACATVPQPPCARAQQAITVARDMLDKLETTAALVCPMVEP